MSPDRVLIHCAINRREGRPVAVSARKPDRGFSSILKVERQALDAGYVFVLYRSGPACKVLTASMHRNVVDLVRSRLTRRPEAYAVAVVPVVQSWG
jgi:hypothetical protein